MSMSIFSILHNSCKQKCQSLYWINRNVLWIIANEYGYLQGEHTGSQPLFASKSALHIYATLFSQYLD